jgi:amidohydrolase
MVDDGVGEGRTGKPAGVDDSWDADRVERLFAALDKHLPDAVDLRRRLHREPRLSGEEDDTTRMVVDALGLPATFLERGGALVRLGEVAGPAIGLRGELDALPVVEDTGVDWASTSGAMHACGHDVHLAATLAVTRALLDVGAPCPLVVTLQPREETLPSGAKDVVESPEFAASGIAVMIGVHVQPRLEQGHFAATPGPVNAAADQFTIVVNGLPGHAAYPHLTADPVVAAADLVGTLQHLVSRQVDPTNPTVLTVGSISGGNSPNVVPAAVRMTGILRTFDEHDRVRLHESIASAAQAVATVHGCEAEVEVSRGAPVLDNEPELTTAAAVWLERAGLHPAPALRSCGADDFSYYCDAVPSLMVFLGVGAEGPGQPGLHHPRFLPPEQSVGEVARAMLGAYLGACARYVDLPAPEPRLS